MKLIVAGLLMLVLAVDAAAQATKDAWNFADEDEATSSLAADLREQAADLTMFTAFATLALVSFFRKSERLKWITMGAAVLYLGFARSQLITIVNVFGLIAWNLPVFRHNMTWYLFAIFTVVTTVLWGRLYCGRVCAFGAMTQLFDKIVPARLRFEVPDRIERRASYIKYGLLGATVLYFGVTKNISIYRYVEPFWMFSLQASTGMWMHGQECPTGSCRLDGASNSAVSSTAAAPSAALAEDSEEAFCSARPQPTREPATRP